MHVSEVMTVPVYTMGEDEAVSAAWETMRFRRTRHLVVNDRGGPRRRCELRQRIAASRQPTVRDRATRAARR